MVEKQTGHAGVYLGIRLVARQGGRLQRVSAEALKDDPRVLEIGLTKEPGHFITLPPADYNSWVLGYIIARIPSAAHAETDLTGLIELAKVEVTSLARCALLTTCLGDRISAPISSPSMS